MPIRQDVQGSINAPELQGYQAGQVARAQLQNTNINTSPDASSQFWASLAPSLEKVDKSQDAKDYLQGQQDSMDGKERQQVHSFMSNQYEQGYNRATVTSQLAQFQMDLGTKAVEFVNQGKSPEEWQEYVTSQTNAQLAQAGAQGMDLKDRDWQSWLQTVEGTRNTAADLYQTKNLERSNYLKQQSNAAAGSAAISMFQGSAESGNPAQALENLTTHVGTIMSDPTMSAQQKDGTLSAFVGQSLVAAKTTDQMHALSAFWQNTPEFQKLPTQTQTQLMQAAQSQFNQRAADESGQVYSWLSQMRDVSDPTQLEQTYPMASVNARLGQEASAKRISPAQAYSMSNEEFVRRTKLAKAANVQTALSNGTTMSDISTISGLTMGKTKEALTQLYSAQYGGYSGGGAALVGRGLQSGAWDIASLGIDMLQQDAKSLGSIDSRNLKTDSNGSPIYPQTVVNSLSTLKNTYDQMVKAGNNVQAEQLVSGLPDSVAYGIRQAADANSMASVVYRRADEIASGALPAHAARMDPALLGTRDDVTAGLFDTSLTQKGSARNILGIQSYIFTSKADEAAMDSRLDQFNKAMGEEYTSLYNQGQLPARQGDDLKKYLVGRIAARTIRVDDGTDNGSLLILPQVANKAKLFGSEDNNIIAQGLKDNLTDFHKQYPGATGVSMRYDQVANELVLSATDKDNVNHVLSTGIPATDVANNVKAVEARLTSNGQGTTTGALAVPNAGMVKFNFSNQAGVDPTTYGQAVRQLISYEGYTDTKGYSILATHPTTGAQLNDAKYVKQPGDSPQVATDKFQSYLNDQVVPQVQKAMPQFASLPEELRARVFSQLMDTTYHSGNSAAFGDILGQIMKGDTVGAYKAFRSSALYKDAGADSRRNQDRFATMQAVSQYRLTTQPNGDFLR